MEQSPVLSEAEMIEKRKWAIHVPAPPESDWPTMRKVELDYPNLCGEEHTWILYALLDQAHKKLKEERENNHRMPEL